MNSFTSTASKFLSLVLICSAVYFSSCQAPIVEATVTEADKKAFVDLMQKHLDAVTNRDLATLESTLAPDGNMQLILPGTEVTNTVEEFVEYHSAWFKDTTTVWTFDTKILNTVVGPKMGIAVTEILYKEPERNGVPYFNRMNVSYGLKKFKGRWCVIKDHASSIEKSTDKK